MPNSSAKIHPSLKYFEFAAVPKPLQQAELSQTLPLADYIVRDLAIASAQLITSILLLLLRGPTLSMGGSGAKFGLSYTCWLGRTDVLPEEPSPDLIPIGACATGLSGGGNGYDVGPLPVRRGLCVWYVKYASSGWYLGPGPWPTNSALYALPAYGLSNPCSANTGPVGRS